MAYNLKSLPGCGIPEGLDHLGLIMVRWEMNQYSNKSPPRGKQLEESGQFQIHKEMKFLGWGLPGGRSSLWRLGWNRRPPGSCLPPPPPPSLPPSPPPPPPPSPPPPRWLQPPRWLHQSRDTASWRQLLGQLVDTSTIVSWPPSSGKSVIGLFLVSGLLSSYVRGNQLRFSAGRDFRSRWHPIYVDCQVSSDRPSYLPYQI